MGRYKRLPENYFKFVNPIIISLFGVAVYLLLMAWLDPRGISNTYFGRVGDLVTWAGIEYSHVMKQILLLIAAIHISEAMVAVYLCHNRNIGPWATIAWTIQTLLFGISSLHYLIWPGKDTKPSKKDSKPSKKDSKPSKKESKPSKREEKSSKAPKKSPEPKDAKKAKGQKDQKKSKAKKDK